MKLADEHYAHRFLFASDVRMTATIHVYLVYNKKLRDMWIIWTIVIMVIAVNLWALLRDVVEIIGFVIKRIFK